MAGILSDANPVGRTGCPSCISHPDAILIRQRGIDDRKRRLRVAVPEDDRQRQFPCDGQDGKTLYPHMYGRLDRLEKIKNGESLAGLPETGPEGWYEYRASKFAPSAFALWYWTHDQSALDLLDHVPPWVNFINGSDPTFPERALEADLEALRQKVEGFRADLRSPDTTMSDDMNHFNPATIGALTQLMLGGIPTGRDVHALHAQLRYFDPARRRAGLPEQVAHSWME